MPLGKNTKRIRLFGGNDFQLKINNVWTSLGHLLTGTLEDKTDSAEITFADGNSIDIDGKRKVKLMATLAQTSKEEIELVDTLRSGLYAGYYFNGKVDGKNQAFYFKQINLIPSLSLKSPDSPMNIVLEMSVEPQSDVYTVTPSTDFPAGSPLASASAITTKNVFYGIVEE